MEDKSLGQIAYEAYCESVGGKSIRGEPLPSFEKQAERLQKAWESAALAVQNRLNRVTNSAPVAEFKECPACKKTKVRVVALSKNPDKYEIACLSCGRTATADSILALATAFNKA